VILASALVCAEHDAVQADAPRSRGRGDLEHDGAVSRNQEVGGGRGGERHAEAVAKSHARERVAETALADGGGGADLAGLDEGVDAREAFAGEPASQAEARTRGARRRPRPWNRPA
jgi:hypothetical protein